MYIIVTFLLVIVLLLVLLHQIQLMLSEVYVYSQSALTFVSKLQ